LHRAAQEILWWQSLGIASLAMAEVLWQKSQSGEALTEPLALTTESPPKQTRRHGAGKGQSPENAVAN